MNNISIVESFKFGARLLKKNWPILVYALLFPAIFSLILDHFYHADPIILTNLTLAYFGPVVLFYVIKYLITTLFKIGKFKINLDVIDGNKSNYLELFTPKKYYFNFIVISILLGLSILGGFIFFILPGIYIIITYSFAPILVIDKKMSISEAFTKSKEMTTGNKIKIFWYYLIYGFLSILFMIGTAAVYGVITSPQAGMQYYLAVILFILIFIISALIISNLAIFHVYRQLLEEANVGEKGGQLDFQDLELLKQTEQVKQNEEKDEENMSKNS